MPRFRRLTVAIVSVALLSACGSAPQSTGSPPVASDMLPAAEPELTPTDAAPAEVRAVPRGLPTLQTVELDQPAIWPASDVVFETPEEAAASFVSEVLGVDPVLGDFMAGDSRSGEMQVFSPGEVEGAELLERGLLGLRIIGPNDGWFVIAASSAGVAISLPETLDEVAAGPLVVTGEGRGFEGTIVVTAFTAGDADDVLDQVIAAGGAFETLEPFSATLDLSGASPGDTIALIVRGDTGLGGDPGDFTSVPIVIDSTLPATS